MYLEAVKGTEKNPYTIRSVKSPGGQPIIAVDDLIKVLENFKGEKLLIDGVGSHLNIEGIYRGELGEKGEVSVVVLEVKKV
jgi:hypothetical protein